MNIVSTAMAGFTLSAEMAGHSHIMWENMAMWETMSMWETMVMWDPNGCPHLLL